MELAKAGVLEDELECGMPRLRSDQELSYKQDEILCALQQAAEKLRTYCAVAVVKWYISARCAVKRYLSCSRALTSS